MFVPGPIALYRKRSCKSELQLKSQDSQTSKGSTDVQSSSFKGTFTIKHRLEKHITGKVDAKNHTIF